MACKKVSFDIADDVNSPLPKAASKGTPLKEKKARGRVQKHIQMTLQRMREEAETENGNQSQIESEVKGKNEERSEETRVEMKKSKKRENEEDETEGSEPKAKKAKATRKPSKTGESEAQKSLRETVGVRVLQKVGDSKKMLGFHVSAAGGLEQAIHNARAEGCRSFALFVRNQRTWNHKPMTEEVVNAWKRAVEETRFPLDQVVPHGSYLMNAGSPESEKLEKSREAMVDECRRAERLGIFMYNFHPGSTVGKCSREECMRTIAETIDYVTERTERIVLVLETMAGQGNSIGGKFEELRDIIEMVKDKSRVGVCIDTCHIFAAGYDLRTPATYASTMSQFESVIGWNYLKAMHINDSKGDLGSNLDRHEHIGQGKLGKMAFELLMNDDRFDGIPMILETPEGKYPEEMMLMYGMNNKNIVQ